jgi:fructose-bisphosphate aldolase class II
VAPAIALGVAMFIVGTVLKHAFWAGLESATHSAGPRPDVHRLLGSHKDSDVMVIAKERMTAKVRSLIRQYGGSGRQGPATDPGAR